MVTIEVYLSDMDLTLADEKIFKNRITSATIHNMREIGGFGYFPGYIFRRCSVARDVLVMCNMYVIVRHTLPCTIGRDRVARATNDQLKIMGEYAKDIDYCYATTFHESAYSRGTCIRLAWFRALDKLE